MCKVSAIIRDCHTSLLSCIETVRGQLGVTTEIFVVGESSTNSPLEQLAGAAPHIVHVQQEKPGAAAAWNAGICHATGEYVIFLEADARLTPGLLASQINVLESTPNAQWSFCACERVTQNKKNLMIPAGAWPLFKDNHATHFCHFNFIPIHAAMLKRSLIGRVGNFDTDLAVCEGHDYWLRCIAAGSMPALNPDALVLTCKEEKPSASAKLNEYIHHAILHEKVRAMLSAHPNFPMGHRPDALLAHAAGCLTTAVHLYNDNKNISETLFSFCSEAVRQAAKSMAMHRKDWIRTCESDSVLALYVNCALEQLDALRLHGEKTLIPTHEIIIRLFPEWNITPDAREENAVQLLNEVCCSQPYINDFTTCQVNKKKVHDIFQNQFDATPSALPRISIVVATFNAEKFIQRALRSIEVQHFSNWEIIVQDGGSTDKTLTVLRQHKQKISCVSSPDTGLYDAWNKAIPRITGDWTLFLGADDFLVNDKVLLHCAECLSKLPSSIVYAYGVLVQGKQGKVTRTINRCLHDVYRNFVTDMGLPFPATFIRTSFLKQQSFNTEYRIAADFELAARTVTINNVYRIPFCVSFMELGGMSSDIKLQQNLLQERKKILHTCIVSRAQELVQAIVNSVEMLDREIASPDSEPTP